MKKRFSSIFAAVVLMFLLCGPAHSEEIDMKGRTTLGLIYTGASLQYGITPKIALEGRFYQVSSGSMFGARLYYFKSRMSDNFISYFGAEADTVSFKGVSSEGSGTVMAVILGGEYTLNEDFFLGIDIGPAMISLKDSGTSESISGMDFVVNFSINYTL